ncbi:putative heavy metal-associated isoprenylated plant protein 18 [Cocos nucifera]|uniref:Putative heavy metal-associated isoprenylated plant protein 18 n=1 Tax=Cocos nucifera TaxID=13894 RepID=A0A8K0N2A2_COCNU|nr:putative heavy metal-associated isoprenylated plant protein 18 [Cocos nucifera]
MEGVTSFEVDLENKKVVVMGDITPLEVLESVSKVKFAELWVARESSKSALFDEGTNAQT